MLESSAQQAVTPQMVQRFARTARERIRIDGGSDHLRVLAQRVEVADREVRIIGSKSNLLQTLTAVSGAKPATPGVRSSVLKWRRGWDSNPRYACTHNGFRDRPDRPLWHPSERVLIGVGLAPGNSFAMFRGSVSDVDSGSSLRIFRALFGGSYGPPRFFALSGILGVEVIYPLRVVVSVPAPVGLLQVAS